MRHILVTALALLISIATFIPAHAGNIVELEGGAYVLESELPRVERKLNITVTKAAQAHPSAWRKALETGEPVALETETVPEPAAGLEGLWRLNLNEVATESLVYDKAEGVLDVRAHDPVIVERQRSLSPTAWAALAGALMLLSHLLVRMGMGDRGAAAAIFAAAAFAAAAFAAAAAAFTFTFAAFAFTFAFASGAFAAGAFKKDVRKHGWATSALVVLMAVVGSSPWW